MDRSNREPGVGCCPGERIVGERGQLLSPEMGRFMGEGPVEGGGAAAVMGWRGCLGTGDLWPFGDKSLGLSGTARTGEYRAG